jgi:hypothetical protein
LTYSLLVVADIEITHIILIKFDLIDFSLTIELLCG